MKRFNYSVVSIAAVASAIAAFALPVRALTPGLEAEEAYRESVWASRAAAAESTVSGVDVPVVETSSCPGGLCDWDFIKTVETNVKALLADIEKARGFGRQSLVAYANLYETQGGNALIGNLIRREAAGQVAKEAVNATLEGQYKLPTVTNQIAGLIYEAGWAYGGDGDLNQVREYGNQMQAPARMFREFIRERDVEWNAVTSVADMETLRAIAPYIKDVEARRQQDLHTYYQAVPRTWGR